MKKFNRYYDIFYILILLITIAASIIYGQILEANVGKFGPFMVFGVPLSLPVLIIIPIIIIAIFIILFLLAKKNNFFKINKVLPIFIFALIMIIYMGLLIFLKDNTHLYSDPLTYQDLPSLNDRIFSFLTFTLGVFVLLSLYLLFKNTTNIRKLITILLIAISLYSLSSIIYSLITEIDLYKLMIEDGSVFDKTYEIGIHSFYKIGNVYGHTIYIGIVSLILLSIYIKKYWISLLSIPYVPFLYFSASRAAILGTLILYGCFILYLIFCLHKNHKKLFYTFASLLLILVTLAILDMTVFHFIKIGDADKKYGLADFFVKFFNEWKEKRLNILEDIYSKANIFDYVFGFGYGIQFIVPRTYGYIYYLHNTFLEYLATGGIFYSLSILILFIISFIKLIKIRKYNPSLLAFFIILILSQIGYGFFESIPVFPVQFFGIVFSIYFFLIPNLEYDYYKGINYKFKYFSLAKNEPLNLSLNYEVYDYEKFLFPQIESYVNELKPKILDQMENTKTFDIKAIILCGMKEKVFLNGVNVNKDRYLKLPVGYYDKESETYYLFYSLLSKEGELILSTN